MSLYREAGSGRRQGLLAGAVALMIGLGAGFLLGASSSQDPSFTEALEDLRSDLAPVSNGLELLAVEYPQGVSGGEVISTAEYEGSVANVERIRDTVAENRAALAGLEPAAVARLEATLAELSSVVASKADPAKVNELRTRAAIELTEIVPPPEPPAPT